MNQGQRKPSVEEVVLAIQDSLSLLRSEIIHRGDVIAKQSEEISDLKKRIEIPVVDQEISE